MFKDMCDAKIITVDKNKGVRYDCINHKGITVSLFGITGKAFALMTLPHLQKLTERVYPESQCGFRSQHSTTDMTPPPQL